MKSLSDLSKKLLIQVSSYLCAHDLLQLILTASKFKFLEHQLWEVIELHPPSFHLHSHERDVINPRYNVSPQHAQDILLIDDPLPPVDLFWIMPMQLETSKWSELAWRVGELCSSLTWLQENIMDTIKCFTGLEKLDIYASFPHLAIVETYSHLSKSFFDFENHSLNAEVAAWQLENEGRFANLTNLRLRGYIPRRIAQEIIYSAPHSLKHLDLAVIEGWKTEHVNQLLDTVPQSMLCELDLRSTPFNSLTHLHLCKPNGSPWVDLDGLGGPVDAYADKDALLEWRHLITSSAATLQEIVFDLRELIQRNNLPERQDENGVLASLGRRDVWGRETGRRGDSRFCEVMLPVFREVELPKLRRMVIRGLNETQEVMGPYLWKSLRRYLGAKVGAEVVFEDGKYMAYRLTTP